LLKAKDCLAGSHLAWLISGWIKHFITDPHTTLLSDLLKVFSHRIFEQQRREYLVVEDPKLGEKIDEGSFPSLPWLGRAPQSP